MAVKTVHPSEQRIARGRKLQDNDLPAGLQHPDDLPESRSEIPEITHSESHRHHVHRRIRHLQALRIPERKHHPFVQSAGRRLPAGLRKHIFRKIDAQYLHAPHAAGHRQCQVARTGRYVENPPGLHPPHDPHHMPTPQFIDLKRKRVVQPVVRRSDAVEHLAHLFFLVLLCIVWFHLLCTLFMNRNGSPPPV